MNRGDKLAKWLEKTQAQGQKALRGEFTNEEINKLSKKELRYILVWVQNSIRNKKAYGIE